MDFAGEFPCSQRSKIGQPFPVVLPEKKWLCVLACCNFGNRRDFKAINVPEGLRGGGTGVGGTCWRECLQEGLIALKLGRRGHVNTKLQPNLQDFCTTW